MKIENLDRAIQCAKELDRFESNLEVIKQMVDKAKTGDLGLRLHEHTDNSGLCTEQFYLNGNFHKEMMAEIIDAVLLIVVRYEEELRQEIDDL